MLRNIELAGYDVPTPIQKYALPAVHLGYDVIGIAQTGKISGMSCSIQTLSDASRKDRARRRHI
jgi:superfamily II DNA/RNA helicase